MGKKKYTSGYFCSCTCKSSMTSAKPYNLAFNFMADMVCPEGFPDKLSVTFTNISDCKCLDKSSAELKFENGSWSGVTSACGVEMQISLFYASTWQLELLSDGVVCSMSASSYLCNPPYIHFNVAKTNKACGGCANSASLTAIITS